MGAGMRLYRSAYHRISDDSISSYGGHRNHSDAIREAARNASDTDIDHVWVHDPDGFIIYEWPEYD